MTGKTRIVQRVEMAIARQWHCKYLNISTCNNKGSLGSDVFYVVHAEAI
jgi:hypothetical protein